MRILVKGLPPYEDGEYNADGPYSMEQLYSFVTIANVRPTEFGAELAQGHPGLLVALTKIALERKAYVVHLPILWAAMPGQLLLDFSDEDDAVPPPSTSDESLANGAEQNGSSGMSGSTTGDSPQESAPSSTGTSV